MARHPKVKPNRDVDSWVKNFTKSIAYSASSVIKDDIMPTTFENISSAKDIAVEMKDDLLGQLFDISPGSSSIDVSAIGKESKKLFKDALNDIKTGNFATPRNGDNFASDMEDDFGIDMDFKSTDIEDENGNVSSAIEVSNDARLTSRAILDGAEYTTDAMNSMTIAMMTNATQNARAQTKSSQKTTLMAVNTLGTQLLGIQHRIDALNATAGTIVDFLRESQAQANEKAIAHYGRMEEAIAKEISILGQQQAVAEKNLSKELRRNGFNSTLYMNQLKNNIENSDWYTNIELVSSMAGMITPFLGLGDSGMRLNDMLRPTEMLMKGAIRKVLPKKSSAILKRLDKSLPYHFTRAMTKLGTAKDSGGILGFLADTFGLDPAKSAKITFGDYTKGAVQWDGYSKKALEEVIPFYLSRIDAGINKTDRMIYNYKSGSFKTEHQAMIETQEALDSDIQKQFAKMFDQIDSVMRLSDSSYRSGWNSDSEKKTRTAVSKMAYDYSRDRGNFFDKNGSRRTSTMRDAANQIIKDKNGKEIKFTREKYLMYQINDFLKGYQFKSLNGKEKTEIAEALYDQITQAEEMSASSELAKSIVKSSDGSMLRDLLANGKFADIQNAINMDGHKRFSLYDIQVRDDVLNKDTVFMNDQKKARNKSYERAAKQKRDREAFRGRASQIFKSVRSKYDGGIIGRLAELGDTLTENAKEFNERIGTSGIVEKVTNARDRLDEILSKYLENASGSIQNLANMSPDEYEVLLDGGLETIKDFFNGNFESPYDFDPNAEVIYESDVPAFFKSCGLDSDYYKVVYATDRTIGEQYFVSASLIKEPSGTSGGWSHWPRIITLDMIKNRRITQKTATEKIKWNCERVLGLDEYKATIRHAGSLQEKRERMHTLQKHIGTSATFSDLVGWYSKEDTDYALYNNVKDFIWQARRRKTAINNGASPKDLDPLTFSLSGINKSTDDDYLRGGLVLNDSRASMILDLLQSAGLNKSDGKEIYDAFYAQFADSDVEGKSERIKQLTEELNNATDAKERKRIQKQLKAAKKSRNRAKIIYDDTTDKGWLEMYYNGIKSKDQLPAKIQQMIDNAYSKKQQDAYMKNILDMQKNGFLTPAQLDLYKKLEFASDMDIDTGVKLFGDDLVKKQDSEKAKKEKDKADIAEWKKTLDGILLDAAFPKQQRARIIKYLNSSSVDADQIRRIITVANAIYDADEARYAEEERRTGIKIDHRARSREIANVNSIAANTSNKGGLYESGMIRSALNIMADFFDFDPKLSNKEYQDFVKTLDSWFVECLVNDGEDTLTPELECEYIGRLVLAVKGNKAAEEWFKMSSFPDRLLKKVQADDKINHEKYVKQVAHSTKVDVRTERAINTMRYEAWAKLRIFAPSNEGSYFTYEEFEQLTSDVMSDHIEKVQKVLDILNDENARKTFIHKMRSSEAHGNNTLISESNRIKLQHGDSIRSAAIAYDYNVENARIKASGKKIDNESINAQVDEILNNKEDLEVWKDFLNLTGNAFASCTDPGEKEAWLREFDKYKKQSAFKKSLNYLQTTDFSKLKDISPLSRNRDINAEIKKLNKRRSSNMKDPSSAAAEKWRMFEAFTHVNSAEFLSNPSISVRQKAAYIDAFMTFDASYKSQENWNPSIAAQRGVKMHGSNTIAALNSDGSDGRWQEITRKLMPFIENGDYEQIHNLLAKEYSMIDPFMMTTAMLQIRDANSVKNYTNRSNLKIGPVSIEPSNSENNEKKWQAVNRKVSPFIKAGNYTKAREILAKEYPADDPSQLMTVIMQQQGTNSNADASPMHGPGDGSRRAIMPYGFKVNHKSIGYGEYIKNYDIEKIKGRKNKRRKLNELGDDRGLNLRGLTRQDKLIALKQYDAELVSDAKEFNIENYEKMNFDDLKKVVAEKRYAKELRHRSMSLGIRADAKWTTEDYIIRLKAYSLGLTPIELNRLENNKAEIIKQTYSKMQDNSSIDRADAFAFRYGVNATGKNVDEYMEEVFNRASNNVEETGSDIRGIQNKWTDAFIGNIDVARASAISGMKESTDKMTEEQRKAARKKKIGGAIGALLGAAITGRQLMNKRNLGILSAAVCLGGPIGGGLLGLGAGIAASGIDFKKLMFGEENIDENGDIKKKAHATLLKRIGNAIKTNVFDEARVGIRSLVKETGALIKEKISVPLTRLFTPLRKGFETVGDLVGDKIAKQFQSISNNLKGIASKLITPGSKLLGLNIRAGSWMSRKTAAGAVNMIGSGVKRLTNRRRIKDFKSITAEGKNWKDTEAAIDGIINNKDTGLMKGVWEAKNDKDRKAAFEEATKQIEANESFYNSTYGLTNAGQVLEDELKYAYDQYIAKQNTKNVRATEKQRRRIQSVRAKVRRKHGNDDFSALTHDELVDAIGRIVSKDGNGDSETIKKIISLNDGKNNDYFDKYAVNLLTHGDEERTAELIKRDADKEENEKLKRAAEFKDAEEKKTLQQKIAGALFGIWNIMRGTPINILSSVDTINNAANNPKTHDDGAADAEFTTLDENKNNKTTDEAEFDHESSNKDDADESKATIIDSEIIAEGVKNGMAALHDEKASESAELSEEQDAESQGKNRGQWFTNAKKEKSDSNESNDSAPSEKEKGESKSFVSTIFSTITGSLGKFGKLGKQLMDFGSSVGGKIAEMLPVIMKFAKPLLGLAAANPLATAAVVLGGVGLFDFFFNDRKIIKWIGRKAMDLVGGLFGWVKKLIFGNRDPSKGWSETEIQDDGMVKQESTYLTGGRTSNTASNPVASAPGQSNYLQGNTSVGTGYLQGDPRWGKKRIGTFSNGKPATMENAGCVYTAISDALNPYNRSVGTGPTPDEVAATALANGEAAPDGSGTAAIINRYGGRSISDSSAMLESLRNGNPVIVSGQSAGYGPSVDVFPSTNEHVVTAQGLDANGNAIVDNPMHGRQIVPFDQLARQTHAAWSVGYGPENGNSSITGKENEDYTFYSQVDPRWSKLKTGPKDTVGSTGCLLTSQAMGATLLNGGTPITPADLAPIWEKYGTNGNANAATDRELKNRYGIELADKIMLDNKSSEQINASVTEANKALASGYPVDFHGNPKKNPLHSWKGSKATSENHNMLVYGVDDSGNWLVLDPGSNNTKGRGKGTALRVDPAKFAQNGHWMRIMSKNGNGVTKFENQSAMANQINVGSGTTTNQDGASGGFNIMDFFGKFTKGISAIANSALKSLIGGTGYQRVIGSNGEVVSDVSPETVSPPEGVDAYAGASASPMLQNGSAPYGKIESSGGIHRTFNIDRKDILTKDLGNYTEPTADQLNAYIARKNPSSPFVSHGQTFINAGKKTGLDPRYLLSHAAIETGWGTSKLAREKNNYFGIQAYNNDPINSAKTFSSGLDAGIEQGAQWIRNNFYNRGQRSLESMIAGDPAHTYATYDKKDGGGPNYRWANQIAGTMNGMGFGPGPNSAEDIEFQNAGYGTSRTSDATGVTDRLDTLIDLVRDIRDSKKDFNHSNKSVGHGQDTISKTAKDKIQETRTKNETKAKQNMNASARTEAKGDLGRTRLMQMHQQIATGYRKARVR